MSQPTLLVCKSCNAASQKGAKPAQGACLLEQLQTLQSDESQLKIKSVDCLWMCEQACVVAISAVNKPTYLFVDLPVEESMEKSAEALTEFASLYRTHPGNAMPYRLIPDLLKSGKIAKVPPVPLLDDE